MVYLFEPSGADFLVDTVVLSLLGIALNLRFI